jgi:hypothetical protein
MFTATGETELLAWPPSDEPPAVFLEKAERKYRELIETLRINAG